MTASPTTKLFVKKVVDEIFALKDPIIDPFRRQQISDFVETTVNGDSPSYYLVVTANMLNGERGCLVYILTNHRIINFQIDAKEVKSSSVSLSAVVDVRRRLVDDKTSEVEVVSSAGTSFGLRFEPSEKATQDFFQYVDLARAK